LAQGYSVEQDSMRRGASALEDASVLIDGHIKTLNSEVEALTGGWRGQAQTAFVNLHANWTEAQTRLLTALRDMHTALVSTGQTYTSQEQNQAGAFSNIAGQL
jgi:WXG100 family type VII secretion target